MAAASVLTSLTAREEPARASAAPARGRPRAGRRGRFEAWVQRWSEPLFALVVLTWLWTLTVQARVPMSTAMITMASLTLVRGLGTPAGRAEVDQLPRHPLHYWPAALLVAYLLVFAWTSTYRYAWERVEFASQLLLVPVAFFVWRAHLTRWRDAYVVALCGFAAAAAGAVAAYALANYDALVVALGQGRAVPVPRGQHVPFAVALAFAVLLGVDLLARRRGALRWWGGACAAVCALALHLVAVRTGLVLLYLGFAGYGMRWAWRRWGGLLAVGAAAGGLAVLALAALQIPSVERRVAYARYDLERATSERAGAYSDGGRVLSFRAALAVIADDPLLGAGPRGMGAAMAGEYDRLGLAGQRHAPTNQWLFSWTYAGLAGFVGVWCVLLTPLWARGWWRRPLVAEWMVLTGAWWMVESPLETAVGPALALAVLYLILADRSVAE